MVRVRAGWMVAACLLLWANAAWAAAGDVRVVVDRALNGEFGMAVVLEVGRYDDGDNPGITRLTLESLVGAGAGGYPRLLSDTYAAGGELEVVVGAQSSVVRLHGPAETTPGLAVPILDRLFRADLRAGDVDRARERALSRFGRDSRTLLDLVASLAVDDPRMRAMRDGEEDTMDAIEAEAVMRHAQKYVCPGNTTVVLVGEVPPQIEAAARGLRGGKRTVRPSARLVTPSTFELPHHMELQVYLFPVRIRSAADLALAEVSTALLEQELTRVLRGAGVAYSPVARLLHQGWQAFIMVQLALLPATIEKAEPLVARVLKDMGKPFPGPRVEAAMGEAMGERMHATLSARSLLERDLTHIRVPGLAVDALDNATRRVTPESVASFAAQTLAPENTVAIHVTRAAAWRRLEQLVRSRQ